MAMSKPLPQRFDWDHFSIDPCGDGGWAVSMLLAEPHSGWLIVCRSSWDGCHDFIRNLNGGSA